MPFSWLHVCAVFYILYLKLLLMLLKYCAIFFALNCWCSYRCWLFYAFFAFFVLLCVLFLCHFLSFDCSSLVDPKLLFRWWWFCCCSCCWCFCAIFVVLVQASKSCRKDLTRGQFHKHFTCAFFVQKFCLKLFCACSEG